MSDHKTKRPMLDAEAEELFRERDFEDPEFYQDEDDEYRFGFQDPDDDHDSVELEDSDDDHYDNYDDDDGDALEFADDGDVNEVGHGHRALQSGQVMPAHPEWRGGTLVVPPRWKGMLSGMDFSVRHQPTGTILIAEIPGETTAVMSALCTDGEGLLDTVNAIDAAIAIASEPDAVPKEYLVENSLSLHFAITLFNHAAEGMEDSMAEVFRPPDRAREYDAQKAINQNGALMLRATASRVQAALTAHIDPLLNLASVESQGIKSQH